MNPMQCLFTKDIVRDRTPSPLFYMMLGQTIVINTVLNPILVCPVEWNISVPADFDVPFQGVSSS